jgi:hypothetical protein
MKAWQLTLGLAVLAVAAGQLSRFVVTDDAPPLRARLDRVVGDADYGFVGPEELRARVETATANLLEVENPENALAHEKQGRAIDRMLRNDPRIRACLGPRSGVFGSQIVLHMQVQPDGSVSDVCVTDPAILAGTDLASCLSSTIGSMTFPKPPDGAAVSVTYPFEL